MPQCLYYREIHPVTFVWGAGWVSVVDLALIGYVTCGM